MKPVINEYELEQAVAVLAVVNPGRAHAAHIRDMMNANWPFDNIAIAGWVLYAEAPGRNANVRVALTPYSTHKYMFGG